MAQRDPVTIALVEMSWSSSGNGMALAHLLWRVVISGRIP